MADAQEFQAAQHPELDKLSIVAIHEFLKKITQYIQLLAKNIKADGVNGNPITLAPSIDPEQFENLIDMKKIDADSVDDCTDESVME
jgi:hypothetical protein